MHALSEAEIQVLIVLIELSQPIETPNNNFYRFHPQTVEEAAAYFKGFRADWGEAYDDLAQRGLLETGGIPPQGGRDTHTEGYAERGTPKGPARPPQGGRDTQGTPKGRARPFPNDSRVCSR